MSLIHTLRFRLTLWYALVLALIVSVFVALLYAYVRDQLLRRHDPRLAEEASIVATVLSEDEEGERFSAAQQMKLDQIRNLAVLRQAGTEARPVYESPDPVVEVPTRWDPGSRGDERAWFETVATGGRLVRTYSQPFRTRSGHRELIRLAASLEDLSLLLDTLRLAAILLAPLAALLSAAGGYWLAGRALAPVDEVIRTAGEIEATSLSRRLRVPKARDEIGRLVATFNQMIGRLEASFAAMRRFTADASHELRGPLTTMRSAIDVVLARPRGADAYRLALTSLGEDVDRLRSITEDLLVLARADAGRFELDKGPVRLDVLSGEIAESCGPEAARRGVALRARCGELVVVLGDERWLRQLVLNLVDNAVKFSARSEACAGKAREVSVAVAALPTRARLTVRDAGPGIPEEALGRIFERFYRVDAARPYGDGSGLGLSIAAWIVEAHGGTITARNHPEGGASFSVDLPLAGCGRDANLAPLR